MSFNPSSVGPAIAAAVKTVSVPTDEAISDGLLEQIWTKVAEKLESEGLGKSDVDAGTFQVVVASGSSAGTYPVTGKGGPIS